MEKLKIYLPPVEKCPNISFTMKLLSFLICLVLGFILTVLSIIQITYPIAHYRTFSLWYSLSNIIWLISTFILIGPKENYTKLLSDELYTRSVILSCSIILGFFFGILTSSKFINLFFDFFQFGALLVFCYSYIPVIIRKTNTKDNEEELQENSNYENSNNNYLNN